MKDESLKIRFLTMEDVISAGALDMKATVNDVEEVFLLYNKKDYRFPNKIILNWGDSPEDEVKYGRINAMPGYIGGDYKMAGIKWSSSAPENPFKYRIPRSAGVIILNDLETKYPIAIMEASIISAARTGAVTGVAAKYLSKEDSKILGLVGAGVQNRTQLKALLVTRPGLKKVFVYDIHYERSLKFSEEMSKDCDIEIIPVKNAKDASINSDIIVTATLATEPILHKEWLSEGVFYANIGGNEATFDAILHSDKVIVDNWSAVEHRGISTVALMFHQGVITENNIYADLGEIVNNKKPGRVSEKERIYFNAVGMVIEDLAVASRIYKVACNNNIGTELKLWERPHWV